MVDISHIFLTLFSPDSFVVCEKDKFLCLSEMKGSCFQVTSSREELCGYKVAVVKDWVLNKAR